jgi:S-adenosyl-L-methionine hydrolase (adenosine-forming)
MPAIITLTTDFGTGSPYVAQIKGVILSICRDAELVDLSHAVAPQNVREGAVVLADTAPWFPEGTVHVAVIDPGVGTARRLIYSEIGRQRYLTPDNGLVSLLAAREHPQRIVALENSQFWLAQPSATFHGRDILAPVAAHLAAGVDPGQLGPLQDNLLMLDWPQPRRVARGIAGEVLYVDSFGNILSNIRREHIAALGSPASMTVEVAGRQIRGLVRSYGAALAGECVALIDSQDRLEIAVVEGNAARDLSVRAGAPVVVATRR